jgi:hypothetical protein
VGSVNLSLPPDIATRPENLLVLGLVSGRPQGSRAVDVDTDCAGSKPPAMIGALGEVVKECFVSYYHPVPIRVATGGGGYVEREMRTMIYCTTSDYRVRENINNVRRKSILLSSPFFLLKVH